MTEAEFVVGVKEVLEWPDDAFGPETVLKGTEVWDSAAVLAVMMFVEEKLGTTLKARDLDKVISVRDLSTLVRDKLS